jgi:PAS domain S-box-containing protein
MKAPTILLVDENRLARVMLREPLAADGFAVVEAEDGSAALELMKRRKADLVLLDLVLPDMSGVDLARDLRALPGGEDVPVVAIAGFLSRREARNLRGARFEELVTKPVEQDRLIQIVRSLLRGPEASGLRPRPGLRVLVVDDDPVQRRLIRARLDLAGFDVTLAKEGREALRLARRAPPDAVLSDVLMPGMDGFRLCQAMRRDPALARVPVVLLSSSYAEPADRDLAMKVGASALVERTPGLEQAIDTLGTAVRDGPRLPSAESSSEVEGEYVRRVVRQLERQNALVLQLTQRCSTQAAMLAVSSTLAEGWRRGTDLESGLGDALTAVLDISGVSRGAIHLEEDDRRHLAASCGYAGAITAGAAPGETMDTLPHARAGHEESALVLPLSSGSERLGTLLLESDYRALRDEDWNAFARALGAQLGQAIGLDRAMSKLRASEEQVRLLLDSTAEAIYGVDVEGRCTFANAACLRLVGCSSQADIIGKSMHQLMHHTRRDGGACIEGDCRICRSGLTGEGELFEDEVLWRDDRSSFDAEIRTFPLRRGEARVGAVVSFVDITARKKAEAQVHLQHTIAVAASEAGDLNETLEVVLRLVGEATKAALADAWVPSPGGRLEVRAYWARRGSSVRYDAFIRSGSFALHEGLPGRAWASRQAAWVADLSEEPAFSRRSLGAELGLASAVAVPVVVGDEVVAILELFFGELARRDESLVRLLSLVATQVGSVLQRRRAEEALRRSEEQLRQAQKMEAIGQLTGGIAHDFNNVLAVILSYASLLAGDLQPGDPMHEDLREIQAAGERAAALTSQLLAFSRRQILEPRVLDLNELVAGVEKMLRRLIGEDVELAAIALPEPVLVHVDPGQIGQVLMNLAANARDAMPDGGKLTIEIARTELDASYAADHPGVIPGPYVLLAVTDTGVGMDKETQAHVFEPFFTTKEVGRGTGLGLSTVFGIVRQSGGHIWVYSEPGNGTTFKVYLPPAAADASVAAPGAASAEPRVLRGSETILLVEDEEPLRKVVRTILSRNGYRVLEAQSGGDALLICEQHPLPIHLMLSDLVMPRMSGVHLAARLGSIRPGMPALFMSGYTGGSIVRHGILDADTAFIQKPFTPGSLLRKVRQVLEKAARSHS